MIAITLMALSQALSPEIQYAMRILPQPEAAMAVHMSLQVDGDADGETLLRLPSEWGGETELWRGIAGLDVEGGTLLPAEPQAPQVRAVEHEPGAALTVRWQVIQDRDGQPSAASGDHYRPWVQADYIHLLGETIFIHPERDLDPIGSDAPVGLRFDKPDGLTLASDLTFPGLTLADLGPSVTVAGDFRVASRTIDGAEWRVAVRGRIVDEQIIAATEQAMRGNLAYWGAQGEPFLVTGLPIETQPGRSSFGGTNLGDAFAIFGTDNVPDEILRRMLVHEHAHSWVPIRLGGMTQGAGQPADYWFSEGFTDFVTTRAGLLSGAWDAEGAIDQWNEFLAEYMSNAAREQPNSAIRDGFWTDEALNRLPYLRGNLFAALIDHRIRQDTDGAYDLDDVLFAMLANADRGPAADVLVDTVGEVAGVDISQLHRRHIIEGETIILPKDTFGPCGEVQSGMEPVFVYGLTLGENPDGEGSLIVSVDAEGPAAPAGFEAGMVILERVGGRYGDASVDSAFRVRDASGAEQVLSYRPTNGEQALEQRIVPADGDLMANGCADRLAGRTL